MTKEVGFYCVLDFGLGVNYLTWKMLLELNVTMTNHYYAGFSAVVAGETRNFHLGPQELYSRF